MKGSGATGPAARLLARVCRWLLVGLYLAGCGPPILVDVDGRPIKHPALIASADGGWIAVDTSCARIRAVLELRIETPDRHLRPSDLGFLTLRFGADRPLWPARFQREAPTCSPAGREWLECLRIYDDTRECKRRGLPREEVCLHLVRAEFVLHRLPSPSDSAVLRIGESTARLRWRR